MTRSFVTLLVLGLSSCISSASTTLTLTSRQSSSPLSGSWINEFGATMILTADKSGGLTGQYNSEVGNLDATKFYNLTGRFDTSTLPPSGAGIPVGWVLDWKNDLLNDHAVTTWSGQYFNNDNVETILTQWLLTISSSQADVGQSFFTGHDEFTRAKIA
ncbi:MAG: Avidin/streptavidin [Lentinula lateritia]|uniref:Avidin/streptavidin n=1 Tax=Lentinula lateritia TaxID=40482 RepID=A0ABQ8UYQ3_9AGAR|nr:MAG: Avidin/streptavidin [Lentinula lateritia]KAJ4466185.1 Avidin/streptavidin [Lentinula lateritia]